jgi:hypothetical protein
LTAPAATAPTRLPARVEPVNDTIATSRCPTSASPTAGPVPVTTLTTPSGMPARCAASANATDVIGVSSDGLSTIVLPAAIAGRIFHAAICRG